ncbi:hypothetical protein B0T26DRAFT_658307 [Lasiosphaeria miniovina]|uniref:DUF3445 domain-containing protein n=1 Tax=Lasiosphaeria miniovina TaxID=1954250 RepID=A0AA39ZUP1_9PEZI|nr:uncharacterized protein B0T26DRAFT_658307 [Lasiosphaeria miniovina]KAK0703928.1 hypothetical protein B0T26DRAFT_658307 [Lasiosphaeria miniovina]
MPPSPSPPPHALVFPPSRRHALASLPQFEKATPQQHETITPAMLRARALTTKAKPDLHVDGLYTPTGFATQDIRALGRFPDYAVLAGVRHPEPVGPGWDIARAVFRPYRPFRWGYHQHMALMKYEPDWWVELERGYTKTMAARQALLQTHGDRIFFAGSGAADLAARELMEMLLQFLCRRYPAHFRLERGGDVLVNGLLGTVTDLVSTPPLRVLFENVPEDYAIMLRNEDDGLYYLRAAMVCSSVGWDIAQHRDSPLRAIHTHVPDAGRMAMSMDRWFSRLATDTPVSRCSWSLEDWEVMFTSPEADAGWTRSAFAGRPDALNVGDIRLRCDAQTLRRLPVSGAVVFSFKAVFTPLAELRGEPFVPALLHRVLRDGKANLIGYKCVDNVRRVAMEALEMWAAEQAEQGIVPPDWEVGTLDESPFFPGWREKLRRQQGF